MARKCKSSIFYGMENVLNVLSLVGMYMLCFLFCLAAGICKDCTGKIKNTITRKLKYINNQSIEQLNAFGFALQPLLPKNRIGEPFHQLDLLSPNRPPTHPTNRPGGKSANQEYSQHTNTKGNHSIHTIYI